MCNPQPPATFCQLQDANVSRDILMFVEDPGAANYVAGLLPVLASNNIATRLLTSGFATEYLRQRGIHSESIHAQDCTAAPFSLIPYPSFLTDAPSSLLLVGTSENPDSLGLRFVEEWRQAGRCSVGVVDASANAAHRFRGRTRSPLAHAPDWLIVPDAWTKQAYVELGFTPQRIAICGHPHYDAVRLEGERLQAIGRETLRRKWLSDARAEQQILVFVAEISAGLEPQQFYRSPQYTLHGWGTSDKRTDIVIEELLDAVQSLSPRPSLVLRLHPKNTPDEFAQYSHAFDHISSGGIPLELIYAADLVVGMSSMLLLEAALLGRPTLSILPRKCEMEWLPTTRAGITPCATTRPALHFLLPQILLQSPGMNTDINAVIPSNSAIHAMNFLSTLL